MLCQMNLKVFPLYQSIRDAAVISEQYNLIAYISQSYQDEAKHQLMVSSSNSNDALFFLKKNSGQPFIYKHCKQYKILQRFRS